MNSTDLGTYRVEGKAMTCHTPILLLGLMFPSAFPVLLEEGEVEFMPERRITFWPKDIPVFSQFLTQSRIKPCRLRSTFG